MKTNMTPMQIVDAAYTACYAYNAECSRKLAGKIVSLFTHKSAAAHWSRRPLTKPSSILTI